MADQAVTITKSALDVVSGDVLTPGEGATQVAAGDTAVITPPAAPATQSAIADKPGRLVLIIHEDGGGAATVTMEAGDKPPAMRQGLTPAVHTIPVGDALVLFVDPSQYLQDNGTIRMAVTGQNVDIGAFQFPDEL